MQNTEACELPVPRLRSVFAAVICAIILTSAHSATGQTATSDTSDASVFDDVEECDLLAAHPSDQERVADGVADDAIVPRLAIKACEEAARQKPEEARFAFQLGRAYLAAQRRKEAVAQFERASLRDYGAAHAYLGDAYQFGHGVEVDATKALSAYRKSLAKGFGPAEGQIEMLVFDQALYMVAVPKLLYGGEHQPLSDTSNQPINVYLYGFITTLSQECSSMFRPAALMRALVRRYPENWTPEADVAVNVMRTGPAGELDAKAFLRRHGCEGPVAKQMGEQINRLLGQP